MDEEDDYVNEDKGKQGPVGRYSLKPEKAHTSSEFIYSGCTLVLRLWSGKMDFGDLKKTSNIWLSVSVFLYLTLDLKLDELRLTG